MAVLKQVILFFATGFYSGYFPKAPGTAGSIVGVALALYLRTLPTPLYWVTLVTFLFLSIWIAGAAEQILEQRDPSIITIDEIVGILIAFSFTPLEWPWLLLSFFLFRLFDIFKPFPIRRIENHFPGGWGVVLDDALAGLYTAAVVKIILFL